jgi:Zn-dependent M16 (insulinase) family peptidase
MEATSGYSHIKWLGDFADHIDERLEGFAQGLKASIPQIFCRKALTAGYASTDEISLDELLAIFPEGKEPPAESSYKAELPKKSAYEIPAQIGFSAQAATLQALGEAYSGSMSVASQILSFGYLWNMVRVQGGAYGTGLRTGIKGSVYSYSFRDPTPAKSLEINKGLGDFLRGIAGSGEPLDKFIISTIAGTEPLRGVRAEAMLADSDWFSGFSREDIKRQRMEILGTTPADLEKCAGILDRFAEEAAVCLVANKALLEASPEFTVLK